MSQLLTENKKKRARLSILQKMRQGGIPLDMTLPVEETGNPEGGTWEESTKPALTDPFSTGKPARRRGSQPSSRE